MGQLMFAINTLQGSKKIKCAWNNKRKEESIQGITKTRSRLIRPIAPLIVLELPDKSLDYTNKLIRRFYDKVII